MARLHRLSDNTFIFRPWSPATPMPNIRITDATGQTVFFEGAPDRLPMTFPIAPGDPDPILTILT